MQTENPLQNAYIGEYVETPFTPWVNTVAYYPLEKDWNDYSWNWHNLTWSWTPTYTTSWGTKQVANLWGNKVWKIANLSGTYTNYTFNVWCKPTNTNTWQEIFDNYKESSWVTPSDNVYFWFNSSEDSKTDFFYQYRPNGWTNTYQRVYWPTNRTANTRYNVALTSTSGWIKIYVNWTQMVSNSTTGSIVLDSGYNTLWGRYATVAGSYLNYFSGYLSEFIFENNTWTAQEIVDYYNQTKSNYWL